MVVVIVVVVVVGSAVGVVGVGLGLGLGLGLGAGEEIIVRACMLLSHMRSLGTERRVGSQSQGMPAGLGQSASSLRTCTPD